MEEITKDIRIKILQEKLQLWRNTLFSYEADAKVAQQLMDAKIEAGKGMLNEATANMKQCTVSIDALQKMIAELQ